MSSAMIIEAGVGSSKEGLVKAGRRIDHNGARELSVDRVHSDGFTYF